MGLEELFGVGIKGKNSAKTLALSGLLVCPPNELLMSTMAAIKVANCDHAGA